LQYAREAPCQGKPASEVRLLLAKKLKNFVIPREATDLMLRKDELPIHDNIKDAVATFDQLRLDAELIRDSCRQTGGLREIVSGYAIGN